VLLTAIACGEQPLSHEALDEHAGPSSVEHLRSLLVPDENRPAVALVRRRTRLVP
jgi:hypothetical protein